MDASLHDYTEQNAPKLHLTKPVLHPNNNTKVIGHTGVDKVAGSQPRVAAFPRKKEEHWFRGQSTSGLTGYGISVDVLEQLLHRPNRPRVKRVVIIETDNDRVIEYDFASFLDGQFVAYSPKLEECVIGEETMRVDSELFNDNQRVVPIEKARRTFERDDVTIFQ